MVGVGLLLTGVGSGAGAGVGVGVGAGAGLGVGAGVGAGASATCRVDFGLEPQFTSENTKRHTTSILNDKLPSREVSLGLASFLADSGRDDRVGFPQTGWSGRNGFTISAILGTV